MYVLDLSLLQPRSIYHHKCVPMSVSIYNNSFYIRIEIKLLADRQPLSRDIE